MAGRYAPGSILAVREGSEMTRLNIDNLPKL
jgi:hypothetical protein